MQPKTSHEKQGPKIQSQLSHGAYQRVWNRGAEEQESAVARRTVHTQYVRSRTLLILPRTRILFLVFCFSIDGYDVSCCF